MKQRLLVMNGSKIVQIGKKGGWKNQKVGKAGDLKPGIYNIFNAKNADVSSSYSGLIVHADKDGVYQQVAKSFVTHRAESFSVEPKVGSYINISYSAKGEAVVESAQKLARTRGK